MKFLVNCEEEKIMINFKNKNFYLSDTNNAAVGLSLGATTISTAAIIGFGGLAGWLGFTLFICTLGMMLSIYLMFSYIGPKVFAVNKTIQAKTFIELLSKYYDSNIIRKFTSLVLIAILPFYSVSILIGVGKFLETFWEINYTLSILIFCSMIIASILYGGMKTVLNNDKILGSFMIIGSLTVLIYTFIFHIYPVNFLDSLGMAFSISKDKMSIFSKSIGFTGFTDFPDFFSPGWLFVMSTFLITIPIGVISVPQSQVRLLLVKDENSFRKILPYALIIPALITSSFFLSGIASNSFYYLNYNQSALDYAGSIDNIIPAWLMQGYPQWFSYILMITLLSAAFTTLNSMLHLLSTTVSNDLFEKENKNLGIFSMFAFLIFSIVVSVYFEKEPAIISRSSVIYFAVIGGSLFPSVLGMINGYKNGKACLYSFSSGILTSGFWLLFIHFKESKMFTGITIDMGRYNYVDAMVPTLLVSSLIYVLTMGKKGAE